MAKKPAFLYRLIRAGVRLVYPKLELVGAENIPKEPVIVVGNHAQAHGPIAGTLFYPGARYVWCTGEMMRLKDVPAYAYRDFWSAKPRRSRWFYKLLSYLIAPLSVCIFNSADTIAVYHDARLLSTYRKSVAALQAGASLIIFPEHNVPHNQILWAFQDKFVDTARFYYKKTGRELSFVPMYVAPRLKKLVFGQPIRFCAANPIAEERARICACLMDAITAMACALPPHTVVPYPNVPKKQYPTNLSCGVSSS